ncbi:hypothetical protein C0Q70_05504 [Pomacea canaliculata]|uniref:Death domain-containing protein n=1 Tax=Pomacea canaliculata TaxID=400727 RepID=A0A2T7PLD0_POMCA|nr:hypothetical protein C0Q70_05504 [Pomacea canaliculata]
MPTLRRSKSLNDKIARQKNRAGDIIRDPRSPEAEGRTRQCVDNFQALVHLRRQTEDKARQLELALSYASGSAIRHAPNLATPPTGGVEIPFYRTQYRNSGPPSSEGRGPGLYRRQRSADNRASKERIEGTPQVIQNMTESQRVLGIQNQVLLNKVEELEFQTAHLKKILSSHNISCTSLPAQTTSPRMPVTVVSSCPVTPLTAGRPPFGGALHAKGEHSVSGYSSLAESACNGGLERGRRASVSVVEEGRAEETEDECTGVRKLSAAESVATLESRISTLARSLSSGDSISINTLSKDTDLESLHEVLDRALQREQSREASLCARIEELEKTVSEVTTQKAVVLRKYWEVLDDNRDLRKSRENARRQLRALIHKQRDARFVESHSALLAVVEQLHGVDDDVLARLDHVITTSSLTTQARNSQEIDLTLQLSQVFDQLSNLTGLDHVELATKLGLDVQKTEKMKGSGESEDDRRRVVAETWLAAVAGDRSSTPLDELRSLLAEMDLDVRLFERTPVHGPERQALVNTLAYVTDHVTEARVLQSVLDELVVLDILATEDVSFVRQVLQVPARGLARMWHVAQYCGTGVVSTMALAFERSGLAHVAIDLQRTHELELQNSRLHSQNRPLTLETSFPTDTQTVDPGQDLQMRRSRPSARSFKSKPKVESLPAADPVNRDNVWSRQLPPSRLRGVARGPILIGKGEGFTWYSRDCPPYTVSATAAVCDSDVRSETEGDQNGKDWGPLLSESPQTVKDEGQLAPQSSGTVEKTHEATSREVTKGDGVPYDRGWAWMIVLGTFINITIVTGYLRSTGIIFVELLESFRGACIQDVTHLWHQIRSLQHKWCRTSHASSPGEVLVGAYFKRRRSLALAIGKCGGSVGSFAIPPLVVYLLQEYGLRGTLLVYGAICFHSLAAAFLLRPTSFYKKLHQRRGREAIGVKEAELDVTGSVEGDNTGLTKCVVNHIRDDRREVVQVNQRAGETSASSNTSSIVTSPETSFDGVTACKAEKKQQNWKN